MTTVTFVPEVVVRHGRIDGSVTARTADGRSLHVGSGNFASDVTRSRFARIVAERLCPVPDRPDEGEKPASFDSRRRVAVAERDRLAAEYRQALLAMLDQVRDQHDRDARAAEEAAAAADAARARRAGAGDPDDGPYFATNRGLFRRAQTRDGEVVVPLTNFAVEIVEEEYRDDGVETEFAFRVRATPAGGRAPLTFAVPAKDFGRMEWVTRHLGNAGVVHAGRAIADHARAAIQLLSRPARRTVYAHTGWRELDGGRWAYLTAGGAIGADGVVAGVDVDLPGPLALFHLPPPPDGDDLRAAVRASLNFMTVAEGAITVPLYAGLWRSVLGSADMALNLTGSTGAFKSSTAAPLQQHFGPAMTKDRLPASWASTANALESLASAAKDVLFTIDEFLPKGTPQDVQQLHRKAEQVIRGSANSAGRARMTADLKLRPARPPRCLILMTGEELPHGESLRARMAIVEVKPGDIDKDRLRQCQADAAAGLYAAATAGFVRWLAPRYAGVRDGLAAEVEALRAAAAAAAGGAGHARTPEHAANLAAGLRYFLAFAVDCGAVTAAARDRAFDRAWGVLCRVAAEQAVHHLSEEPTARFVDLLRAALVSGVACLHGHDGGPPRNPAAWGWRDRNAGEVSSNSSDWVPLGGRVGWVDGDDVYLDANAALRAANDVGGRDGLAETVQTLKKRLKDRNLLVTPRPGELQCQVTLEGERRFVMRLRPGVLAPVAVGAVAAETASAPPAAPALPFA